MHFDPEARTVLGWIPGISEALCSVLPLIPLTLVANEARWILATWKAQGVPYQLRFTCAYFDSFAMLSISSTTTAASRRGSLVVVVVVVLGSR